MRYLSITTPEALDAENRSPEGVAAAQGGHRGPSAGDASTGVWRCGSGGSKF